MASITERKNKDGEIISYQIKVSRGRDPLTGKQLTPFTMTYTPPDGWSRAAIKRDITKAAGEFEAACKRGEILTKEQQIEQAKQEQAKITFAKYAEMFLHEKSAVYSPGTLKNHRESFKKAILVFGDMKMADITMIMVKQYIGDIQANGKNEKNGKPLSYATVFKYYALLHTVFQNAVENEIIPLNPMMNLKPPKPRTDEIKKEIKAYSESEARYIIECLDKEPLKWRALVTFMIDSGCRKGEVVGLKWSEIDWQTGKVNICLNAQYTNKDSGSYIKKPKTGKTRTIKLNPPALSVMREWRKEQATLFLAQGIPQSGFCFTQEDGRMMNPHSPTGYLRRFGKKYNLPGIHPHALRHTMATLMIANGADIASVSAKLGHSKPAMTLNVYTHANEEAQQRANDILAAAIYDSKKAR